MEGEGGGGGGGGGVGGGGGWGGGGGRERDLQQMIPSIVLEQIWTNFKGNDTFF